LKVGERFFLEGKAGGLLRENQQIINGAVHVHWDSLWRLI
jgi:hypothetical protein